MKIYVLLMLISVIVGVSYLPLRRPAKARRAARRRANRSPPASDRPRSASSIAVRAPHAERNASGLPIGFRQGEHCARAQDRFRGLRRLSVAIGQHKPGNSASGARLRLTARTSTRIAGASGFGWIGRTPMPPKPSASAASTASRPSARQISVSTPAGRRSHAAALDPMPQRRRACRHAQACGRRSGDGLCAALNGGFISTWSAAPAGRCRPRRTRPAKPRHRGKRRACVRQGRCARRCRAPAPPAPDRSRPRSARGRRRGGRPQAPPRRRRRRDRQLLAGARRARRRQQDGVMADAMALARLAQDKPAAEHGVFGDLDACSARHRGGARAAKPASSRSCRAASNSSSSTRMRRGKMPIEPSSTLILRSTTMCLMCAPLSNASIAEISTASLVRTSSRIVQLRRRSSPGARKAR